jgi:hypothetical protein
MGPAALLAIATVFGYLAIAPAVVNGDGLGYLTAAVSGNLYPGHLAYLPLLRGLRAIAGAGPRPIDGLAAARLLSAVSAGIAVLALAAAARRLYDHARAPTVAALGLAASFGTIAAGSDVETYAPALAALCGCVYAIARRRTGGGAASVVAAGLALAAAILLHLENVLYALPAAFALAGRDRLRFAVAAALPVAGAYAAAIALGDAHAIALAGASHGFRHPLSYAAPGAAIYGAAKALLYAPYPYDFSPGRVLGLLVPGVLVITALAYVAIARDPARPTRAPLGRAATLAWALPYAAVGLAYFPSDSERWLFLLPLGWLTVAAARRRAGLALAAAAALLALNLAAWLPFARDTTWRDRARDAGRDIRPGDLVISPGHGWDEYIGVYEGPVVGHFPLAFHVARLGSAEAVAPFLAETIRDARRRGHQIILVRLGDAIDPMGWRELAPFGVTPMNAGRLLPPGRRVPLSGGSERLEP